ncbi:hypothetical protein [Comamonas koreensis]|uniref:Uncharacterized protein n=1 Tax=Comamonas koreensis TaxID=160825 RepID=A0AAW4XXP8_9BURK|nr:hypothetical protein [Comamonas koreensis]MCD2166237.1 hypothetical protein [Comamonas koreensis]
MEHEHKRLVVTDEAVNPTLLGEVRIEAAGLEPSRAGEDEQDDARLHQQAPRRFRPIQLWICLLFFVEGMLGLFVVGWPALILCVLGTLYVAWAAKQSDVRETTDIK